MLESRASRAGLVIVTIVLALIGAWLAALSDMAVLVGPVVVVAVMIFIRPLWGLFVFALLIPLESSFLSLGGGAASATRFVGLAVFGVWLLGVAMNRRKIFFPKSFLLAVPFIAWGVLSFAWAYSQSATLSRMITAAQLLMLMLLAINLIKTKDDLKALLAALFIGCAIATLLGLLGIGVETEGYLLTLQNQGAKEYGGYVGIVFLIGSILFVYEKGVYRWLGLVAVVAAAVPLIQINQRGILFAIAIVWVALLLLTRQRGRTVIFIGLMISSIAILPGILEQRGIISSYQSERLTLENIFETGGTGRTEIWGAGSRMFADNFLLGTGWGNFSIVFYKYASAQEIYDSGFSEAGKDAHSDLMGIGGELGIVGLTLFLVLYASILSRDIRFCRNRDMRSKHLTTILVIALMIYIFSAGMTSTFIWRKVYWLIMGMGIIMPYLESIDGLQETRTSN